MTTIYIDTNIIMNESYFRSPFSQTFLEACSLLKVQVVVPDIVLDEVLGNYKEKIKAKVKEFQKAQKEISKLMDTDEIDMDTDEIFNDYKDFLSELINKYEMHVAPYPKFSLKYLVEESYNSKKPFKDSGEGYKDFLVWETIKEHLDAGETEHPYVFLTNNTKDFAERDKNKGFGLHSDLAVQIDDLANQPLLLTSLRDAWEKYVLPKLDGMTHEDISDLSNDDITDAISRFLLDDLSEREAFGFEGLSFSNDVLISSVGSHNISEITCTKVVGNVIIKVIGSVEIEVTGFIEKSSFYHASEESDVADIYAIDSDWNDHVMLVGSFIDTDFELSIFYLLEESKFVGHEIVLPQEIEDNWY